MWQSVLYSTVETVLQFQNKVLKVTEWKSRVEHEVKGLTPRRADSEPKALLPVLTRSGGVPTALPHSPHTRKRF